MDFEYVVYNSNFDLFTMNTLAFSILGNGAVSTFLNQNSFNPQHYYSPLNLMLLIMYIGFSVYYLVDYIM